MFAGKPIKPHVDLLMQAYTPKAGDVFDHKDLAQTAQVEPDSARYRQLITAWRKRLIAELNIDIDSVRGFGYRVLEENERVSTGIRDFKFSVRSMGKSSQRIALAETSKLDETHRQQQDHAVRLTNSLLESARKTQKQIAFSGRVVALPRSAKGA